MTSLTIQRVAAKPVSGNRRLVVTGRILPAYSTIYSSYDSSPKAEAAAAGLPAWNPVFPAQPKGWVDEDHRRKVDIEQRIADD